jgi:hypothetical protein
MGSEVGHIGCGEGVGAEPVGLQVSSVPNYVGYQRDLRLISQNSLHL